MSFQPFVKLNSRKTGPVKPMVVSPRDALKSAKHRTANSSSDGTNTGQLVQYAKVSKAAQY